MATERDIFEFWRRWSRDLDGSVHPDDRPFLDAASGIDFELNVGRPPTPWDGPLASAKIIFCYANPRFSQDDLHDEYIEIMRRQLDGNQPLPIDLPHWGSWYREQFGFLGSLAEIDQLVAVFNVCPYASRNMDGANGRVSAGLPSTWAAQRHLREVLIPKAKQGEIILVIPRAHQRWGVTIGFDSDNIILDAAPHGRIPVKARPKILRCLDPKR